MPRHIADIRNTQSYWSYALRKYHLSHYLKTNLHPTQSTHSCTKSQILSGPSFVFFCLDQLLKAILGKVTHYIPGCVHRVPDIWGKIQKALQRWDDSTLQELYLISKQVVEELGCADEKLRVLHVISEVHKKQYGKTLACLLEEPPNFPKMLKYVKNCKEYSML